jgi:hypothetical protein
MGGSRDLDQCQEAARLNATFGVNGEKVHVELNLNATTADVTNPGPKWSASHATMVIP